jgi:signal peptidase
VKEGQIVASALQVGGTVVVIPNLGVVVTGLQDAFATVQRTIATATGSRSFLGAEGFAYFLLALSGLLYVYDLAVDDGPAREYVRSYSRQEGISPGLVVGVLAAVLVLAATAAMVVPGGTQQFGIVSAEFAAENPTVIQQGESATIPYTVPNAGLVPVVVYLDPASEGVAFERSRIRVEGRSEATLEMRLTAPEETGYYRRFVTEHRYLALLPRPMMTTLYAAHPWLPILVIDAMLAGGVAMMGLFLLGGRRVRVRRRESRHDRSTWHRLLRYLR